jgi:predicted transcriptional regulator
MADFDWNAYGIIVGSEYRKKVIKCLASGPRTPKQIAALTGLRLNHVSATLGVLEELGTVVCLTPKLRKGKVFQITEPGRKIVKLLRG